MATISFVNAGYQLPQFSNMGIFIKYGDFGKFEIISEGPYHTHMILPDRELYISNNTLKTTGNPMANTFDEYLDLNIMGKNYPKDFLKKYMVNFCDEANNTFDLEKDKNNGSTIFCDSGGFQIAVGRAGIINPIDLAKYYNKNVNLGMVLDIPEYSTGVSSEEYINDLITVQKRNTDYLLKYIDDSVELINIVHGNLMSQKVRYLKEIHNDRIQRLAISSVGVPMSLPRLNLIIELCKTAKELGHYKHFHILGSFNKGVIFTIAKLVNSSIPEVQGIDFTLDASSALQNAVNLTFCKNLFVWEGLEEFTPLPKEKYMQYGYIKSLFEGNLGKFNEHALIPCNCPICQKLKYSYVFRNLRGGYLRNLTFLTHNGCENARYVDMVNDTAKNLNMKEYIQHVIRNQEDDGSDTVNCLRFIQRIEQVGLDKAREEFGSLLKEKLQSSEGLSLLELSKKNAEENAVSKHLLEVIKQYKEIDFENYTGKMTLNKALRSATNLAGVD